MHRIFVQCFEQSEYRAWSTENNGIRRQTDGTITGYTVAINLLGPRMPWQRPRSKFWRSDFTLVQLSYSFVTGPSSTTIRIGRTFLSFCAHEASYLAPHDLNLLEALKAHVLSADHRRF